MLVGNKALQALFNKRQAREKVVQGPEQGPCLEMTIVTEPNYLC